MPTRTTVIEALLLAGLAALTGAAAADVYRYRDPQTGQIKFTNIPPPWLKHPDQAARGPSVEVIREPPPSVQTPPASTAAARDAAGARPEPGGRAPGNDSRP